VVVVDVGVLQWWWAATPNFESQKSWGEISLRRERERERERGRELRLSTSVASLDHGGCEGGHRWRMVARFLTLRRGNKNVEWAVKCF
jgi:hypothetical protein